MKRKLIASLVGVVVAGSMVASTYGQGQVNFVNYTFGTEGLITSYVTIEGSNAKIGSDFYANLLYSLNGGSTFTLVPGSLTSFFGTTGEDATSPGLFSGGTLTIADYVSGPISFIVQAFNGADYASSLAKGQSAVFTLPQLATAANQLPIPDIMNNGAGLQSFTVVVPEPSTFALAGLGSAALLMFRRRK
ncbi:MAG TPA: PEP-CTERM sorting domain-containing protein [Verrucomicrobiae bacterium]|nr:PEP-CTERM sorting domain-containing protein [Verrucomicrobiae bacterium]